MNLESEMASVGSEKSFNTLETITEISGPGVGPEDNKAGLTPPRLRRRGGWKDSKKSASGFQREAVSEGTGK